MTSSAPTPASVATPSKLWWGVGLTAIASTVAGVVVFMFLRRRRRLSFSRREVELSTDDAHSDHMSSADGSDVQISDGTWRSPLLSTGTVPRDVQDVDGIRMTPVSSTVTVPRFARDSDGISPSSLQLLLRESAAPAFMGEGLSLVPNSTSAENNRGFGLTR